MSILEILGYAAGVLTTFSAYPQLQYSYRNKDVRSLDVTFMTMLIAGLSLWAVYGFFIRSTPVIVFNTIGALLWLPLYIWKIKSIKRKGDNE